MNFTALELMQSRAGSLQADSSCQKPVTWMALGVFCYCFYKRDLPFCLKLLTVDILRQTVEGPWSFCGWIGSFVCQWHAYGMTCNAIRNPSLQMRAVEKATEAKEEFLDRRCHSPGTFELSLLGSTYWSWHRKRVPALGNISRSFCLIWAAERMCLQSLW